MKAIIFSWSVQEENMYKQKDTMNFEAHLDDIVYY